MNKLLLFFMLISGSLLTSCLSNEEPFDATDQFNKEQAAIDEYLKENGLTAKTDSVSDLRYLIEKQGNGLVFPDNNSFITVTYTGKLLINGTVFDEGDSVTFNFPVGGLIVGWRILLPYLSEGGKMTMYIPSIYGYGNQTVNDIPANSTMIFEVELHRVETKEELDKRLEAELFEKEQELIDKYLEDNNLTAQIDTLESLRYIIQEEGTGEFPSDSSRVKVDYTGKFLTKGDVFATGENSTFDLKTLPKGWRILLPYVSEGGTIVMFLPSKFGYGTKGSGSVPPNTVLTFEVTLDEVVE